jgi:TolB-like protein/Tfp pilus assembly protein PilF
LLLQVADTLGPALRLPEWFQSGVAFVVILGFLPAIIFAWAFELTPDGVKREREVDRAVSMTPQTGQKLNLAIIVLLAIAVVYFAADKYSAGDVPTQGTGIVTNSANPSIAVLPFVNMSDDQGNEFFADGITEELLNLLAKIPELDVTSRSSAFAFKGKEIDIPTVANKLNVEHILEGSVRKSGVTVRITAQLIEADTDRHMWSETYDRELTDIFAIQDEIARKVVDVLQVTLLGKAPASRETDAEAYSLYLEGLHFLELDGDDDWPKAQELFEKALQIDPNYSPAMYGAARAIREQANAGYIDLDDGTGQARAIATKAVGLDPTLAEAWALLSHIELVYDWNWDEARVLAQKALTLDSNNPIALEEMARYEQVAGHLDRSLAYRIEALKLDPLNALRLTALGMTYFYLEDYQKAADVYRRNISLNPNTHGINNLLAVVLIRDGDLDGARAALDREPDQTARNFGTALLSHAAGQHEAAKAATQYIIDNRGVPYGYQIAELLSYQGRLDEAFEWLEISFNNHDGGMSYLLIDPLLKPLHDDPRWRPLLERMNLLNYWDAMPRN